MYKLLFTHKKVIAGIVILTVFTMSAITCFATGSTSTVASNGNAIFTVGNTSCTVDGQITSLSPYYASIGIASNDGEYTQVNSNTVYTHEYDNSSIAVDIAQQFILSVRIANKTDYDIYTNAGYLSFNVYVTSPSLLSFNKFKTGFQLDSADGTLYGVMYQLGNTATTNYFPVAFRWSSNFAYNNGVIIPAKSILSCNIIFTVHSYFTYMSTDNDYSFGTMLNYLMETGRTSYTLSGLTLTAPTSSSTDLAPTGWHILDAGFNSYLTDEAIEHLESTLISNHSTLVNTLNTLHNDNTLQHADLLRIEQLLIDWYGAYNNASSDTNTVIVYASDFSSETDRLHNSESSWYALNDSYISTIGLNNFSYSQSQQDGFGQVQQLFARLWSSLGSYSFVYTFALMVSLAVLIIRHKPKIIKGNKNE